VLLFESEELASNFQRVKVLTHPMSSILYLILIEEKSSPIWAKGFIYWSGAAFTRNSLSHL